MNPGILRSLRLRVLAAGLLAIGVGLRWWFVRANVYPSYDGTFYLRQAWRLAQDGVLEFGNFPPGWPLLVALVAPMFGADTPGDYLQVAEVLNAAFGTVSAVLLFLLARRWLPEVLALASAVIFLFLPESLLLSYSDLSDASYLAAVLTVLLLAVHGRWAGAGAVLGYAFIIRPEGALLAVLLAAAAYRVAPASALRFAGAWLVPFLAYQMFGWFSTGGWVGSSKAGWFLATFQSRSAAAVVSQYGTNLVGLTRALVDLVGVPVILLALWGSVRRSGMWIVLLPIIAVLPLFTFAMSARYLMAPLPGILLAAMLASRELSRGRPRVGWALVAVWLVTLGVVVPDNVRRLRPNYEFFPTMHEAGLWLRTRADADQVVVGRKPYVAFWAGLRFRRVPPRTPLAELRPWAASVGASYLVAHWGVAQGMAPELGPLAEGTPDLEPWLSLVRVFSRRGHPEDTLYLYRVIPD